MPFKSRAQQAWAHTKEGMAALGGKENVSEWDQATKGSKLPEHVKKYPALKTHTHVHKVTEK